MVMVYALIYATSLTLVLLTLRFFQKQMGPECHQCTTLFPLRPAGHRRHPYPSRACLKNNYCTIDAHRPPNFDRSRPNCYFQCPIIKVNYSRHVSPPISDISAESLSNYSLRFVDASFYQVARGLILPFTVVTSYTLLRARPSLPILLSCSIVTLGFFVGVFLDNVPVSGSGILFGVASSLMTALHAAVMKRGFQVVEGSALSMSWYSNLLSAFLLLPFVIILGEGPAVVEILSGHAEGLRTFLIGSAITVSTV
jgi:hypothetical protein